MRSLAGTGLFISASSPATNDILGFNALVYTFVNGVISISEITETLETYAPNSIGIELNAQKKTGRIKCQPVSIELFKLDANAGQLLLLNSTSGNYSYKIVEPSGAITYFAAQTTEITDGEKLPNNFPKTTIRLELSNRVVRA